MVLTCPAALLPTSGDRAGVFFLQPGLLQVQSCDQQLRCVLLVRCSSPSLQAHEIWVLHSTSSGANLAPYESKESRNWPVSFGPRTNQWQPLPIRTLVAKCKKSIPSSATAAQPEEHFILLLPHPLLPGLISPASSRETPPTSTLPHPPPLPLATL